MSERSSRHSLRAFVFTPPVFILLYTLMFITPEMIGPELNPNRLGSMVLLLFVFGLPIAYLGAIIIGLPAYFLLRKTRFETVFTAMVLTGLAAALVLFFMEVDFLPQPEGSSFSYGDSGGRIIKDNVRTLYGWKTLGKNMLQVFFLGVVSGLIFWRLYSGRWLDRIGSK